MYNKLVLYILGVMPDNTFTFTKGVKQMSLPNYTEAQVKALREAQPVTLAVAKQFATDWNKSVKSIVAKSVSLGIYAAAERAERKGAKPTKSDLVAAIAKATQADSLNWAIPSPSRRKKSGNGEGLHLFPADRGRPRSADEVRLQQATKTLCRPSRNAATGQRMSQSPDGSSPKNEPISSTRWSKICSSCRRTTRKRAKDPSGPNGIS